MDASPDTLVNDVRAKRDAIDHRISEIRTRLRRADPRRVPQRAWGLAAAPVVGLVGLWLWGRRRRSLDSLDALLVHSLRELYEAEHQILTALERMERHAAAPELQQLLAQHCHETKGHIDRLRRVFRSVGAKPARGRASAMKGLAADAQRLGRRRADPDVLDAGLVTVLQRMQQDELAAYKTARTHADMLGYEQAVKLLQQTIDEESGTFEALGHLAERFVNPQSIRGRRSA